MQITVAIGALEKLSADVLAVPLAELEPAKWKLPARLAALDAAFGARISDAIRSGDFRGKRGEALTLHAPSGASAKRVLLLGTGADAKLDLGALRDLAAAALRETSARKGAALALAKVIGKCLMLSQDSTRLDPRVKSNSQSCRPSPCRRGRC